MVSSTVIRGLIALILAGLLYGVITFHLERYASGIAIGIVQSEILLLRAPRHSWILIFIMVYASTAIAMMYLTYQISPNRVILMIAVTQISDILQFISGKIFGRHHIGWVSPKKTYEGYITAFVILETVAVIMDFIYPSICGSYGCAVDILMMCLLGALGGIFFSITKRYIQIKDWSLLLGPHGGFLDRTDSLYLPAFYVYLTRV